MSNAFARWREPAKQRPKERRVAVFLSENIFSLRDDYKSGTQCDGLGHMFYEGCM